MAENVINVRLQSAYKTATEWTTANPVLGLGEVGYEIDSGGLFKIGNGTSTWNQLPYSNHRPLTNNDFDTANITDANVGNLIVTGAARFTNVIQGTAASANAGPFLSTATKYAISSAVGGPANSALKLTTNAGGAATPVYFTNGVPTVVNGTSAANWLINSLTDATGVMTTASNIVTQQSGGTTTVYYKRPNAKLPQYATASISDHILTLKNGSGEVVTDLTLPDERVTQTATTAKAYLVGGSGSATTTAGVNKSTKAYIEKELLYSPQARHANTVYGISYGMTTGTPVETIFKTGIKWVSSKHMPVIHITGYAYGLQSPVEFKIGFYIYGNKVGWCGATNMGSWEPKIYLFKYTRDSVDYVAVGLKGSCYFLQLQADVQDEMGNFINIVIDKANWSWEFFTTEGNIPAADSGTTCIAVPYKANILNGLRSLTVSGNDLIVNNNGSTSSLTVPYATSAGAAPYPVTAVIGDGTWTSVTSVDNAKKFKVAHIGPGTKSSTVGPTGNVASNAIWGQSATVPYIEYDAKGHITTSVNRTITFPPNPNTDYKQGMDKDNTNLYYPTGTTSGDSSTATSIYSTAVTIQGTTATAPNLVSSVSKLTIANQIVTGSGTAARDAGSSATPRYFPTLWKYDTGRTAVDGDIVTVKIPSVGGHSYGVQMSIDNGTTYYPIALNGTAKLTTHFPANTYLTLIYEPTGVAGGSYPATGANSTANITKVWRVLNYRDTDSNDTGYYLRRIYPNLKAGSNKIFPYTIILQKLDGRWESIVKSSTTAASKEANTNGFLLTPALLMYANATYNDGGNVGTYNIWSMHSNLIDHRYSFNTANNSTSGTVDRKPVYLVGSIGSDGLFYLNTTKWWTQELPAAGSGTEGTIYWYIGDAYEYYRMTFVDTQKVYIYANGRIREYSDFAQYANNAGTASYADSSGTAADSDKLGGQGSTYYATTAGYGASLGTASNEITLKNGVGTTISHITVPYATSAGAAPYPVVGVTASNYLTATTSNKVVNIKHDDTLSATGSITAGTAGTADAWEESISFTIPEFNYNKGGHLTSASSKSFKVSIPSTSGLATTGYVNERVANAVHFISGFNPSNADALKAPVKEKGDMYVATATGTFYGLELEIGDSIIFQSSVAANINPTSSDFIGVEKTVSVENKGPTLSWGNISTVGVVEGVNLTVKMPADPNTDTKVTAVGNHYTPSSSGTFSPAAGGTTTDISTTTLNIITGLQKDAAGHITGVVSGSIKATDTDTKNTAGSTDTSSKIFLIGSTSQTANSQTYSHDTAYVNTDGCLYSGSAKVLTETNNAGFHNSIYRGKSLGTSITAEQWAAISAGTFDDMYIGDYWTLSTTLGETTSNVQYVIAGFDYWWNCGDAFPQSSNKHHIVLVPASNLYSATMNATNITTGGYISSLMYTDNLANARTGIAAVFGAHLYKVKRLFTNAVNSMGQATGWAWYESSVDLMSETMVYGHPVWSSSGFEVGVDRTILPLFALNPASASIRAYWWLRSVASRAYFAYVGNGGDATCYNASNSRGVRPAFAIC